MKKLGHMSIFYFLIVLNILCSLIPFHYNKSLNKQDLKNLNLIEQKNIKEYSKSIKPDDDNVYREDDFRYDYNKKKFYDEDDDDDPQDKEIQELNFQIGNLTMLLNEQDLEIHKAKIYIILLGILGFILLLVLIIYSSIKCYILCSSKRDAETDYLISKIDLKKLKEVYMSKNGEGQFRQSSNNNSVNFGAPALSNNIINNKSQNNTFNPDNFIPSEQDKKLYKPYNNEEIS